MPEAANGGGLNEERAGQARDPERAAANRLRDTYETAGVGVVAAATGGGWATVNDRLCEIAGYARGEMVGSDFIRFFHPSDRRSVGDLLDRLLKRELSTFSIVRRFLRKDDSIVWVELTIALLRQDAGGDNFIVAIAHEVTDETRLREHQRFLIQDHSHRTRNLLTIVQVLARQIAQHTITSQDFEAQFVSRLAALSASHDLVSSREWAGAAVADIVREQLRPFVPRNDARIKVGGPSVTIRPSAVQHIGMALHELASNACKYGALSSKTGNVNISWSTSGADDDAKFQMAWAETGGPVVEPPTRSGFGQMIVREMVAYAFNGNVELAYDADGVKWRLEAPLASIVVERPPCL